MDLSGRVILSQLESIDNCYLFCACDPMASDGENMLMPLRDIVHKINVIVQLLQYSRASPCNVGPSHSVPHLASMIATTDGSTTLTTSFDTASVDATPTCPYGPSQPTQ